MHTNDSGLFAPDATVRRVHNEAVLLLGGGRALLLQLAHPAVAAGVAAHSSYGVRRFDRLLGTLRSTLAMIYGTREQALTAARHVNRLHDGVRGPGYDARDPALLLWVLSTLIETTVFMHGRFLPALSTADADAYYEEVRTLAPLFGLPLEAVPATLVDMHDYFDATLADLHVSDAARSIATELFRGGVGLQSPLPVAAQLTAGLLPPRIRAEYGLSWGPGREALLRTIEAVSRRALPVLPLALRHTPRFLLPPAN